MIKMTAKLVREQTPVYFNGEAVECLVEFQNPEQPQHKMSQSSSDPFQNLAWASAQIHCYKKIFGDKTESANFVETSSSTALGVIVKGGAEIISSTKPQILFCDLRLKPGEIRTYFYREILPRNGPPTYRGHNIKYFYRITVATQRVKARVQTLSLPIRVLPLPRAPSSEDGSDARNETNEELTPTNPFLEPKKISEVELAWQHLLNITARRLPKYYRISNKRGFVGRFCLFKPAYKLGEDIVGALDFTNREVRCVQFCVTLQSEEILKKKNSKDDLKHTIIDGNNKESLMNLPPTTENSSCTNKESSTATTEILGKITDHTKCHEFCLSMLQTQVLLPVPLYVTPSFSTDLVDIRWRLHFEFVTSTTMDLGGAEDSPPETGDWKAPEKISIETMIWNLPVTLYPTSPLQIYTPSDPLSIVI